MSNRERESRVSKAESLLLPRDAVRMVRAPDELSHLEQMQEIGLPPIPLDDPRAGGPERSFKEVVTDCIEILNEHRFSFADWMCRSRCPEQLRGFYSGAVIEAIHRQQRNWSGRAIDKWRLGRLLTAEDCIAKGFVGYVFDGKLDRIMDCKDYDMFEPGRAFEYLFEGEKVPSSMLAA